jgi:aspartyl protease family protein
MLWFMLKAVFWLVGFMLALAFVAPGLTGRMLERSEHLTGVETPQVAHITYGDSTRLQADRNGHYVTEIQINGRSFSAMVDTGASLVALRYEDARALGLVRPSDRFDIGVRTANGTARARQVQLRNVRLGSIRVDDVDAIVMDEGLLATNLLGMSFLKRLRRFEVQRDVLVLER